ncbi:MAG: hypothetical protein JWM87_3433 [Candidatus Eremiobacteraeota bacterium]|nr:hypothetical protein [Candidatus Eremiobacteraeota bacterium]
MSRTVVIGGGIVGSAIAHRAAEAGLAVTLLERERIGSGATAISGGIVRSYHDDPLVASRAALGNARYRDLARAPGGDCGYRATGLLYFDAGAPLHAMRNAVRRLDPSGDLALEAIGADEGRRRFGAFRWDDVAGAVHEPYGGYVDPVRASRAFAHAALAHGAQVWEGTRALRIVVADGVVRAVETSFGTIAADAVIVAAGAWSAALLRDAGVDLPLRTRRVQAFIFALPAPDAIPCAFYDATTGVYGRPHAGGQYLIGFPVLEWDVDPDAVAPVDPDGLDALRDAVLRRLHHDPTREPRGGRCAFDAYEPAERGIAGATGIGGLFVATGWSGGGVKAAPAAADEILELLRACAPC